MRRCSVQHVARAFVISFSDSSNSIHMHMRNLAVNRRSKLLSIRSRIKHGESMSRKNKKTFVKDITNFMRNYGQRRHPGWTNDRHYSRDLDAKLKRMDPIEFDALLRGDFDDLVKSAAIWGSACKAAAHKEVVD